MFAWNTAGKSLCARRILCFLRSHGLEGAAHQLERETAVFFDIPHLQHLARSSRFDQLRSYVTRFMPPFYGRSPQAWRFFRCLHVYSVLGRIAAGGDHAEGVRTMFPLLDAEAANPHTAALHAFFHQVLQQRPHRDFAYWMRTWELAAQKLKDLALDCPELKPKLHLPQCAPKSWQINLSGVRPLLRPYRKKLNKQKPRDLACLIQEKRRVVMGSLSDTAFSGNETSDSMEYDLQVLPPLVQTAPGALGRGNAIHEEVGEDASKWEKKRKMGSIAEDASSTRSLIKAARKD